MTDLREILINEIINQLDGQINMYFLDCDVGRHTKLDVKNKKYVNYINLGICEQNAISIAAGISSNSQNIAIIASFAEFIIGRCWEQIKHSVVYNNSHAVIIGTHAGFSASEDGASHQCFEDIALVRLIPEIEIYSPAFKSECQWLARRIIQNREKPMYIRLCHGNIEFGMDNMKFQNGYIIKCARVTKYLVISTGYITQEVLKAIEGNNSLQNINIMHIGRLRPVNELEIVKELQKYQHIFIIEEHIALGGISDIIRNICVKYNLLVSLSGIHVKNEFGQSGTLKELRSQAGLSSEKICENLLKWLEEKND